MKRLIQFVYSVVIDGAEARPLQTGFSPTDIGIAYGGAINQRAVLAAALQGRGLTVEAVDVRLGIVSEPVCKLTADDILMAGAGYLDVELPAVYRPD